jgi:hypothetical protein
MSLNISQGTRTAFRVVGTSIDLYLKNIHFAKQRGVLTEQQMKNLEDIAGLVSMLSFAVRELISDNPPPEGRQRVE